MNMSRHIREAIARTTEIAGISLVVTLLCTGLAVAILVAGSQILDLPWNPRFKELLLILLAAAAVFRTAIYLARRNEAFPVGTFLTVSMIAGLVLRIIYVSNIQPEWYSDFLRYWSYGVDMASGRISSVDSVYAQRANFLTRPLIELFGERKWIIPAWNVVLLSSVQLLAYDVVRRVHNQQAAQAFSVLWIFTPEPLFMAAVPNHDMTGLFLVVLLLWLWTLGRASSSSMSPARIISLGAIGMLLAVLEGARGLGLLMLLTLFLLVLATVVVRAARGAPPDQAGLAKRLVASLLIVSGCYLGSISVLERTGVIMQPEVREYLTTRYTTAQSSSLSNGTYNFMYGFDNAFAADLKGENDRFRMFHRSLVISDFLNDPENKLLRNGAKIERLYSLGTQQTFYLRGVEPLIRDWSRWYNTYFVLLFAVALLASTGILVSRRTISPTVDHFLLLLTATCTLAFVLMGESQPRYLSVIWLAGAMIIPGQLQASPTTLSSGRSIPWLGIQSGVFIACLVVASWLIFSKTFKEPDGRIVSSWEFAGDASDPEQIDAVLAPLQNRASKVMIDPAGKPIPTRFGPLSLKLMLPYPPSRSHWVSASHRICGLREGAQFEFQYDAPAKRIAGLDAFELQFLSNDRLGWSAPLPNADGTPVRVRVPVSIDEAGCSQISFRLEAHTRSERASWQRASFVEIYFARIVSN